MSKLMYNGSNVGNGSNNALNINCIDADGNVSTVQAELDKVNEQFSGGDGEMNLGSMIAAMYNKLGIGTDPSVFSNIKIAEQVSVTANGVTSKDFSFTANEEGVYMMIVASHTFDTSVTGTWTSNGVLHFYNHVEGSTTGIGLDSMALGVATLKVGESITYNINRSKTNTRYHIKEVIKLM